MALGKKIHTKIIKSYFKKNKAMICIIKSFIYFFVVTMIKGGEKKTMHVWVGIQFQVQVHATREKVSLLLSAQTQVKSSIFFFFTTNQLFE